VTTRYIYLDDEQEGGVLPIVEAVERSNAGIKVSLRRPDEFSRDLRSATGEKPDGMILDLRLDLVPDKEGKHADYRAPSLAQEIRTRATEREFDDFPIVLWSTQVNLDKSYSQDNTGHDLFDITYVKEKVAAEPARAAREMLSLAEGYRTIRTTVSEMQPAGIMRSLLGLGADLPLDARINERFANNEKTAPLHEYARFILHDVIEAPGALLDEQHLAALLAVRMDASPDWPVLRDSLLRTFSYNGVFGSAFLRWWSTGLDSWWAGLKGSRALRLLRAAERIEVIKRATGLNRLVPASPIQSSYSDRFSTLCEATLLPLDPADGFRLRGPEPEPWQEPRYISVHAALERIGYDRGLRVHPLERERYDELIARVASGAQG
jgi:hypothetical protein